MLIHEKHGYGVKRQNTCYYMRNMDMEPQDKHMLIHEKHGYGVARQNTYYYMRNMDMESQDKSQGCDIMLQNSTLTSISNSASSISSEPNYVSFSSSEGDCLKVQHFLQIYYL